MNKLFNIVAYKLKNMKKGIFILTLVMVLIAILTKITEISITLKSNSRTTTTTIFSGFELVAAIFLFIGIMASFKENFNHLSVNGITRKLFFKSEIIFVAAASLMLFILMLLLYVFYDFLGVNTKFMLYSIYTSASPASFSVLFISLLLMASCVGLLFTILSYRYGTPVILFLSLSPVLVFTVGPILIYRFHLSDIFIRFFSYYFGYVNNSARPLLASLNFMITSIVSCGISWIVIRRMPVKI